MTLLSTQPPMSKNWSSYAHLLDPQLCALEVTESYRFYHQNTPRIRECSHCLVGRRKPNGYGSHRCRDPMGAMLPFILTNTIVSKPDLWSCRTSHPTPHLFAIWQLPLLTKRTKKYVIILSSCLKMVQ